MRKAFLNLADFLPQVRHTLPLRCQQKRTAVGEHEHDSWKHIYMTLAFIADRQRGLTPIIIGRVLFSNRPLQFHPINKITIFSGVDSESKKCRPKGLWNPWNKQKCATIVLVCFMQLNNHNVTDFHAPRRSLLWCIVRDHLGREQPRCNYAFLIKIARYCAHDRDSKAPPN